MRDRLFVLAQDWPFTLPLSVMGAGIDGVSNGLNVVLDEVMLFDRALTPAEVSQVINATRAP